MGIPYVASGHLNAIVAHSDPHGAELGIDSDAVWRLVIGQLFVVAELFACDLGPEGVLEDREEFSSVLLLTLLASSQVGISGPLA